MPELNLEGASSLITGLTVYFGVVLVAFWLAIVIWAFRDMRSRSRDLIGQILVALLVLALNVPGLIIYLLLRPRETLAEAYERSLEEEALLQEIEEKPTCPGCKSRVQADWQVCPSCHTRLKKPCIRCSQMLELSWNLCPYCATQQQAAGRAGRHTQPAAAQEWATAGYGTSGSLEFIDGE